MKLEKYNRPFLFYGIAVLVPWALWFTVAAISRSPLWEVKSWLIFASVLGFLGLCVPMAAAFAIILPDKEMRKELKLACTNLKNVNWKWYAFVFLFPFVSILLAQAISLLFGRSPEQFHLAPEKLLHGIAIFPGWVIMGIAPIFEELGWHTYGIHSIRRRLSLFGTCLVFGIIWGSWHIPLSFINVTYQGAIAESGIIYSINFLVSIIPFLIIDNWCYYKTKRNIFLQISQHLAFNFSMELFRTHPDSKIIHTILMIVFAVVIVLKNKKFFFDRAFDQG